MIALAGCGEKPGGGEMSADKLPPGGYVEVVGAEGKTASITSVDGTGNSISIVGSVKENTLLNKAVNLQIPASVGGILAVATANCGDLSFQQTKGPLFCAQCETVEAQKQNYPKCELATGKMPASWQLRP